LRQETLEQKAKGVCSCSVGFRATLIAGHQIRDFGVGLSTLRTMPGKNALPYLGMTPCATWIIEPI